MKSITLSIFIFIFSNNSFSEEVGTYQPIYGENLGGPCILDTRTGEILCYDNKPFLHWSAIPGPEALSSASKGLADEWNKKMKNEKVN